MTPTFDISGIIEDGLAAALGQFLAANPGPVTVIINSPGGIASEGAAIMAALERHRSVTVIIQGCACSAASLAPMGAARIVMHDAAMMMIHDPAGFTFGPADAHRATADALDKMAGVYAAAYARATGHPVARIAAWMKAETWLTAQEALALNFCDEIEGQTAPAVITAYDYTLFRNPPDQFARLVKDHGWATVSPVSKKEQAHA